ncbi:hypothetical protein PS639_05349 [Pseudomonas fluorescens]|nr:hypothetical protein PS639_05349 [Pseudomonas fluorescens]
MAAGNLNLSVRPHWLEISHLQFSFGPGAASRRCIRNPIGLCASEAARVAPSVRSGLLNNRHFSFAAPLGLLFQPLLYCDPVLFGTGWGTRRLRLLRRLDQLVVAVAQLDVATNPHVRAHSQGFSLLVLPLLKTQHSEVMQRRGIVRLDMQGTLQRGSGLVQLAIFILSRGGFDQGGRCAVALRERSSLGSDRTKRRDGAEHQDEARQKTLGWHQGADSTDSDGTAVKQTTALLGISDTGPLLTWPIP